MASTEAVPFYYQLFLLYIEPFSTLVGAFYAFFKPAIYLELTHSPSATPPFVPLGTRIVLSQLGNLYLLFAINEALVLRSTNDLKVWRAMVIGLLITDFGHLYSVSPLGPEMYWNAMKWNAIDWGNVAFVYCGATTRIAFLSGVGFEVPSGANPNRRPVTRSSQRRRKA
jgi:hypothetical protein